MFGFGKKVEHESIVYRFGGEFQDGIPIEDLLPYLTSFGILVQKASKTLGYTEPVQVRVKPFEEGSFITEFIICYGSQIINIFSSQEANALGNIIAALGFFGGGAIGLVKGVRGKINNFKKVDNDTYEYKNPETDESICVNEQVHVLVQSPDIAKSLVKVSVGPLQSNQNIKEVSFQSLDSYREGKEAPAQLNNQNIPDFITYEDTVVNEIQEEADSNQHVIQNLCLHPLSGSYGGKEKGYSFCTSNQVTYKNVKILDETFLQYLENGQVRFNSKDLIFVDLIIEQVVNKRTNDLSERYSISRVIDYQAYKYDQPKLDL